MSIGKEQKQTTHSWTTDKIAALDLPRLKALKENASQKGASELALMYEQEITSRKRSSNRGPKSSAKTEIGDVVIEYHFVCRGDRGVTFNPDGTFWSASWVVAEDVLKESLRFGAKFALHNSKHEPSYRQGLISGFRRIDDFTEGKVESRIDFLVAADSDALLWAGSGTGEKGYKRVKSSEALQRLNPEEGGLK